MATHRCYTRKQSLRGTGSFTFTGSPQPGKTRSLQKFWISRVKVGSGRNFTETKSFRPCVYHSLQILIYRQEASHSPTQHGSEGTGTVRRHLSEVVLDFKPLHTISQSSSCPCRLTHCLSSFFTGWHLRSQASEGMKASHSNLQRFRLQTSRPLACILFYAGAGRGSSSRPFHFVSW